MPTFQGNTFSSYFKRLLQINKSSNAGVDTTIRTIETGDGERTCIGVSDDQFTITPNNDDGAIFNVYNSSAAARFSINTSTSKVTAGTSATNVLTQYANFGTDYSASSAFSADTHYAIPFGLSVASLDNFSIGSSTSSSFNDTNPSSSVTIGTNAHRGLTNYWYLQDNITIDKVEWYSAADAATGDVLAAHLMKYDLDKGNSATSGDLSSGVVMFDGATVTNNGYEQIHYQEMDDQVTTASAGQVILFTVACDTINSAYSIRCFIKYHIN